MSENDTNERIEEWPEPYLKGGKRANIGCEEAMVPDWFVGWGKDRYCQFEGKWWHMMVLAAKILSSENSKLVVETCEDVPEEFYQPELRDIANEEYMYTGSPYLFGEENE